MRARGKLVPLHSVLFRNMPGGPAPKCSILQDVSLGMQQDSRSKACCWTSATRGTRLLTGWLQDYYCHADKGYAGTGHVPAGQRNAIHESKPHQSHRDIHTAISGISPASCRGVQGQQPGEQGQWERGRKQQPQWLSLLDHKPGQITAQYLRYGGGDKEQCNFCEFQWPTSRRLGSMANEISERRDCDFAAPIWPRIAEPGSMPNAASNFCSALGAFNFFLFFAWLALPCGPNVAPFWGPIFPPKTRNPRSTTIFTRF